MAKPFPCRLGESFLHSVHLIPSIFSHAGWKILTQLTPNAAPQRGFALRLPLSSTPWFSHLLSSLPFWLHDWEEWCWLVIRLSGLVCDFRWISYDIYPILFLISLFPYQCCMYATTIILLPTARSPYSCVCLFFDLHLKDLHVAGLGRVPHWRLHVVHHFPRLLSPSPVASLKVALFRCIAISEICKTSSARLSRPPFSLFSAGEILLIETDVSSYEPSAFLPHAHHHYHLFSWVVNGSNFPKRNYT